MKRQQRPLKRAESSPPRRRRGEPWALSGPVGAAGGGDQPPAAASRRGCLAAAEISDPGPARSSGTVRSPAVPGSAGAVLTGNRVQFPQGHPSIRRR